MIKTPTELLQIVLDLLMSDETRLPITIDVNEIIAAHALAIHIAVVDMKPLEAKTFCENLYALGFKAGIEAAKYQPDPEIWGDDNEQSAE